MRRLWSVRASDFFRPSDFGLRISPSFPNPINHGVTIQIKPAAWTFVRRIPVLDTVEG